MSEHMSHRMPERMSDWILEQNLKIVRGSQKDHPRAPSVPSRKATRLCPAQGPEVPRPGR
jgi:hypothetical protein